MTATDFDAMAAAMRRDPSRMGYTVPLGPCACGRPGETVCTDAGQRVPRCWDCAKAWLFA